MQKPIEPGCLALIIHGGSVPENSQKTVQAIRFVAPGQTLVHREVTVTNTKPMRAWLVEGADILALTQNKKHMRLGFALVAEKRLLRIDDHTPDADDLALYNRHGKLESSNPCQTKQSRFTTRAS